MRRHPDDLQHLKHRSLLEAEIEDAEEARWRARQAAAENASPYPFYDEDDLHPIDTRWDREREDRLSG